MTYHFMPGQPGVRSDVTISGGIRRVDDIGPKGGKRRRFQVWIERRDERRWNTAGTYVQHHYGATFARQWEAVQQARYDADQCRVLEFAFAPVTDTDAASFNNRAERGLEPASATGAGYGFTR